MDRALYGKKRVVLVIDSNSARGARLKRILNKYGYRVYIALNLKEARRILVEKKKIDDLDMLVYFYKKSNYIEPERFKVICKEALYIYNRLGERDFISEFDAVEVSRQFWKMKNLAKKIEGISNDLFNDQELKGFGDIKAFFVSS